MSAMKELAQSLSDTIDDAIGDLPRNVLEKDYFGEPVLSPTEGWDGEAISVEDLPAFKEGLSRRILEVVDEALKKGTS